MLTVDQLIRGAVRQSSPNCEHSAQGKRVRNSSIELLRVIAMLMILLHHFVVHNAFDVSRMPVSLPKFIFYMLFASGGKIAVVIFFSISAWFLLDGDWSIRACWKRVWLLERELIFWSVTLLVFTFCFNKNDFGINLDKRKKDSYIV